MIDDDFLVMMFAMAMNQMWWMSANKSEGLSGAMGWVWFATYLYMVFFK